MSTAISRLFPLPDLPSGSAFVDVNTETGSEFIDGSRECGTAPSRPSAWPDHLQAVALEVDNTGQRGSDARRVRVLIHQE
jgi:hypothetical protein